MKPTAIKIMMCVLMCVSLVEGMQRLGNIKLRGGNRRGMSTKRVRPVTGSYKESSSEESYGTDKQKNVGSQIRSERDRSTYSHGHQC
jgi:hypothetical protein